MKRIFRNDRRGFTTAELLVAALFGMIVMATLYGFYREQLFQLLAQETKTATLEDARGALDMMVRDLRNAGSWGSGSQPGSCLRVYSASSTSIRIQADLDGNGDCTSATGEDVTYDLSSPTSTCLGTNIIRRSAFGATGSCLIPNVVIPPGSSLFTYYDSSNTDLGSSPTVTSIKRVKITFSVQVAEPTPEGKAADRKITSTVSSSVEFRN